MAENAITEKTRGLWDAMVMRLLHQLLRAIRKMPRSWLPLHTERQVPVS